MKQETILKFYARYKIYIFPTIVALSSLFLILVVIYPQASKLIINQGAVSDLASKSNFLETKVQALEGYNQEDLSREVSYALALLPLDKDFGNIVGLMQQVAGQSGFSVTAVSLGNTSNQLKNANSFEVKLEAQGIKNLLPVFLNNLENSKRLIKVSSIDIASGLNPQTVNVSISVEVFYSSLPQNYGTVDSPLPELTSKDRDLINLLAGLSTTSIIASPSAAIQFGSRGKSNPFE